MKIRTERLAIDTMLEKGDIGKRGEYNLIFWREKIVECLEAARRCGVVITIDNPPNEPLAMGNYDLVVSARPLRNFKG